MSAVFPEHIEQELRESNSRPKYASTEEEVVGFIELSLGDHAPIYIEFEGRLIVSRRLGVYRKPAETQGRRCENKDEFRWNLLRFIGGCQPVNSYILFLLPVSNGFEVREIRFIS